MKIKLYLIIFLIFSFFCTLTVVFSNLLYSSVKSTDDFKFLPAENIILAFFAYGLSFYLPVLFMLTYLKSLLPKDQKKLNFVVVVVSLFIGFLLGAAIVYYLKLLGWNIGTKLL